MFSCLSRWGAGVTRGIREDAGSVDPQAQLDCQVRSEQRGFGVKEDWMVLKVLQVLQ